MSHIHVENVTKTYTLGRTSVHALRGVSIEIDHSEFVGIVGPSGSGKSTLLNLVGCIDTPSSGRVTLEGQDTATLSDRDLTLLRRRYLGFIFQSFNLVPVLTAAENIELPLIAQGVAALERNTRVEHMLDLTGLRDYARHRPDELSGGQRQRVAVSRALVTNPSVVLADEPTANLDWENGTRILEAMKELSRTMKTIFVMATHDPRVLSYIDRKVFLEDGRITRIETNGAGHA